MIDSHLELRLGAVGGVRLDNSQEHRMVLLVNIHDDHTVFSLNEHYFRVEYARLDIDGAEVVYSQFLHGGRVYLVYRGATLRVAMVQIVDGDSFDVLLADNQVMVGYLHRGDISFVAIGEV